MDQVAQGFVIIHGPCGGDGSSVKNPATLGAFPVNDLRNGLLAPYPRPMPLSIEIENIPFAVAARDGDDPLRFDQVLQRGVLGCLGALEQSRKPHAVLVSDGTLFRIGEPEWVSLFQLELVGLLEEEGKKGFHYMALNRTPENPLLR